MNADNREVAAESLKDLYAFFGRAVFLVLPRGEKKLENKNWEKITFEATQTPAYQGALLNALARGGNLAVRLGPLSDGLRAIDVDRKDRLEEFCELNPQLRETLRVYGLKGCQFFFRLTAGSPFPGSNADENTANKAVYVLKSENGEEFGEWRFGERAGAYSMIFGIHPDDENVFWSLTGDQVLNDVIFDEISLPTDVVLPWCERRSELSESIKNDESSSSLPPYELKHIAPDLEKRIKAYLEACPASISGKGGDTVLFATACKIANGFALTEEQTYEMLAKWFNPLCEPPWDDKRLRYKAQQAHQAKSEKPRGHFLKEEEWSDPQAISYELRAVAKMLPEMLPEPLRAWLTDEAERMQCPLDFVAVSAVCGLSGLIGAGCGIRPKKLDSWTVIPNLWGGLIGRPGTKKTPAIKAAFRPIYALEKIAGEIFKVREARHKADLMEFKTKQSALESKIARASEEKEDENLEETTERLKNLEKLKDAWANLKAPPQPVWQRFVTQSATIEKLAELMAGNPRGLIVQQDELISLFAQWDRDDRRIDRSFHLQAWSGDVGYITDRIGRGTINTPQLCEVVFGGIQPSKLMAYLAQARGHFENDGLLQRFQLLVYPDDLSGMPKIVDRLPNSAAIQAATAVFQALAKMDFLSRGAETSDASKIPFVHFDDDAQEFFNEWHLALMTKRQGEMEGIMLEHYSKYDSLLPSLALIFQLIELAHWDSEHFIESEPPPLMQVSLENAQRAAQWCTYLESHAQRVFALAADVSTQAADKLLKKIKKGELQEGFNARDVYQQNWALLDSKELAQAAIDILIEAGWLKKVQAPKPEGRGGRPLTPTYRIHPQACAAA